MLNQRIVHQSVGCQSFTAVDLKWRTIEPAHRTAGFLDNQRASGGIPRIEVEFPEPVESSRCHITQIERGRTGTTHAMCAQRDLVIEKNVWILMSLVAGKPRGYQAFL